MAFLDALLSEAREALASAASLVDGLVGGGGGDAVGCGAGLLGPESLLRGLLGGGALPGGLSVGEVVAVGDRVVRVMSLLGEGGFAYVYAVAPAEADVTSPPSLALKRTVGPDGDRLAAAAREATSAAAARGAPGVLPLLASGPDPGTADRPPAFHLLTPLARGGSLDEALAARREARLAQAGYRVSGGGTAVPSARLAAALSALPARPALALLAQAADALAALHAAGLAHCDVKPQNLLVMEGGGAFGAVGGWCDEQEGGEEEAAGDGGRPPPPSDDGAASATADSLRASGAGSSRPASAAATATALDSGRPPPAPALALTDFGSARRAPCPVPTRADAAALQEWADAHTSPAYRPPELFDPPSGAGAALTPAVDVWGLGCVLYFLLAGGVSPFERAAGGAGGSVALAVLAGRVTWPDEAGGGGGGRRGSSSPAGRPRRAAAARALAEACLAADPADRPTAAEVAARARALAK